MKVCSTESVESKPVDMEGADGCQVRWLVGEADGAPRAERVRAASGGFDRQTIHIIRTHGHLREAVEASCRVA